MKILAIDPGNKKSSFAIIEMPYFKLLDFGKLENDTLIMYLSEWFSSYSLDSKINAIAIEMVANDSLPVGKDVFETCVWIGRFVQMLEGEDIIYIYRKEEKMTLCGSMEAQDSNIRQALIDRYAKHDFKNGKGRKDNPDIFYGVKKDVWQAIAVGVTYWEQMKKGNGVAEMSLKECVK